MKQNWTLDELLDLAPAYVMDTLNAEERAAVEAALPTSAELAKEVAEFRAVVERLATEQSVAPTPSVRAKFLERIESTKAVPFTPSSASVAVGSANYTPAPARAPEAAPVSSVTITKSRATGSAQAKATSHWWTTGILATALAASIVFAVNRNSQVKTLALRVAEADSAMRAAVAESAKRKSQLDHVLNAGSDLAVVNLTSTAVSVPATQPQPGMQFYWNKKDKRGMLHAVNLQPAVRGRAYQLWIIKDGKPLPMNVFNSEADGHGLVTDIAMPADMKGVTLMAVTLEPEGGSQLPTSTPFMTGPIKTTE